jgi:two-component system, cell cycle sensor histidine kinase DivJ
VADSPAQDDQRSPVSPELRDIVVWHAGWAGLVLAAAAVLAASFRGLPWQSGLALLIGAAPGAAGVLLRARDTSAGRAGLLAVWAGCGVGSSLLAGGLPGPLAVWCLAPAAAAAVFGGANLLAEAAALSLVAAATTALVGAGGLAPAPPPHALAFWMGFVGLSTTGLGLGAGLLMARRRTADKEAVRRSAETGLERLLSEQPHLILALDSGGRIVSAFGYAPEGVDVAGLVGRRIVDAAAMADRSAINAAVATALVSGSSACVFAPDGAPDRSCALEMRRASDGRLVGVLRDATVETIRQAELLAAREAAESLNAGKSRFLANMSHELRTPLNAIMGFSDVMKAKLFGDLPPKYAEYAEMIHDAGGHLLELINDVLDISKIEARRYELSREPIDARDPVSSALRLTRVQADRAGVSLRGLLPAEPLDADADPRALKQIVLNLISNALKFTPEGGSVTVSVQGYGKELEIVVSDTGVGISEADLKRIGRPYEQAGDAAQKTRGTGLGLSLVRAFAELHGGAMSMESRLGEGTSVSVRLPVLTPRPAVVAADAGGHRAH